MEGIAYLQTRNLQSVNVETEVNVSLSIANLILYSWKVDPEPCHQLFSEQASEVRPENLHTPGLASFTITSEICEATKPQRMERVITGCLVPQVLGPRSSFDETLFLVCHRVWGGIGRVFLRSAKRCERGR